MLDQIEAQFGASQTGLAANPIYAWDQTIVQSAVGNLTIIAAPATDALSITTTSNNEAFYLLQYLQGPEALMTTLDDMALNLSLYASQNNVTINVQIYYSATNGIIPAAVGTNPGVFGSIVYNTGTPVFTCLTAGWSLVPQYPSYSNTMTAGTFFSDDTQLLGWNGRANYSSASSTTNFAIVVSFGVPTSGTNILIESINLCQGQIATRPGAQTADEVLRQCQYYYETSYSPGVLVGANSLLNAATCYMNSTATVSGVASGVSYASPFQLVYNTIKRFNPNVTLLTPGGLPNNVRAHLYILVSASMQDTNADKSVSSFWTTTGDVKSIFFIPNSGLVLIGSGSTPSSNYSSAAIQFQWVADARLGIV